MSRLPRYTRLSRGGPIAKKKRKPSEFARIYHSRERVRWVKSLPCCVCASLHPLFGVATAGESHNAHTETGGTGYKAGYETIAPLCATHHRLYDEHKHPFDNEAVRQMVRGHAARTAHLWQLRSAA